MNATVLRILPLVLGVLIGEALLVFGTPDSGGKCYSLPPNTGFCLSPTNYQIALGLCAFLAAATTIALIVERIRA